MDSFNAMEIFKRVLLSLAIIYIADYLPPVHSAKILAIIPYQSRSHYNVIRLVLLDLADRGHNLTVMTTQSEKNISKNFNVIKIDKFHPLDLLPKEVRPKLHDVLNSTNIIKNQLLLWTGMGYCTRKSLGTKAIQDFINNDNSTFDLVLVEDFYFNAYYMFAHKYKAPLVTYTPSSSAHYINKYMGNSLQAEYVSHEFLYYFGRMTFWQKLINMFITYTDLIAREWFVYPLHDKIATEHFNNLPQPLPTMKDLENSISLVLVNSHFTLESVKSLPPNIIEIAGVHIKPVQTLPEDLQLILDNAEHGVIYFCIGSMLESSELPKNKIDALLEAFSSMKQTILWKWENDNFPNASKNIIYRKWLPQSDVLAHPNIRLFVTHGGLLSLQEAMYHGVPIVGLPFFTDQPLNVAKAKYMGFGEEINYTTLSAESVKIAVNKVLNDPIYRANAKKISSIFRDKPQCVLKTAVFWIEYIIRHKGAHHLKLISAKMPWYEYYMMDIIAFFSTILVLNYTILRFFVTLLFNIVTRKSTKSKDKQKIN